MVSNRNTSFRFASGNDTHKALSETLVTAAISGGSPQPPGPLDQPKQALPADNRRAHARLANDARTMDNRLRAPGRT
jgi:hypothetical protein